MSQCQSADYAQQLPDNVSQIESQIKQIDKSLAEVISLVESMQARLQSVMHEGGLFNPSEVAKKEPDNLSPLASVLKDKRKQIDLIYARLASILSRMEL